MSERREVVSDVHSAMEPFVFFDLDVSELTADEQIGLDIFQQKNPEFDLSSFRLVRYGNGNGVWMECPDCYGKFSHSLSPRCLCLVCDEDEWIKYSP